eukprot:3933519-Rhodomonas_salina.2
MAGSGQPNPVQQVLEKWNNQTRAQNVWGSIVTEIERLDSIHSVNGDLLLSEADLVIGMARWQQIQLGSEQMKHSNLYNSMKRYLAMHHKATYKMFQKIVIKENYSFIATLIPRVSDLTYMKDVLSGDLVMLDPVLWAKKLVEAFLSNVIGQGSSKFEALRYISGSKVTSLAMSAIVVVASVVASQLLSKKAEKNRPILTGILHVLVEELGKVMIHSSLRYKNIFRFLIKVIEAMGPERTKTLIRGLAVLHSPVEAFEVFSGLRSYKSLDSLLKGENLEEGVFSMLDELQGKRAEHQQTSSPSFLSFWDLGGRMKRALERVRNISPKRSPQ